MLCKPLVADPRKELPEVFKPTQVRPTQTQTQELSCALCGVILYVEVPKGDANYTCVCGCPIELRLTQAA